MKKIGLVPEAFCLAQTNMNDENIVKIKVPNTSFWILGEKGSGGLWNAYLINPQTSYKEILRKDISTKSFALFSNIILKRPFPYGNKQNE